MHARFKDVSFPYCIHCTINKLGLVGKVTGHGFIIKTIWYNTADEMKYYTITIK
jgi:hypothetical protein